MLCPCMKFVVLGQSNLPLVVTTYGDRVLFDTLYFTHKGLESHIDSSVAWVSATYSALVLDKAMTCCLLSCRTQCLVLTQRHIWRLSDSVFGLPTQYGSMH